MHGYSVLPSDEEKPQNSSARQINSSQVPSNSPPVNALSIETLEEAADSFKAAGASVIKGLLFSPVLELQNFIQTNHPYISSIQLYSVFNNKCTGVLLITLWLITDLMRILSVDAGLGIGVSAKLLEVLLRVN